MKPYPFAYSKVSSLAEALTLLAAEDDPRIIAGGQSLAPILNMRLAAPSRLIDINGLTELAGIRLAGDVLEIGALTRHAEVADSDVIATHLPLLAQAIGHVAHPAVRNRGTFGGSLCLADPAAEIPAVCVALNATLIAEGPDGCREIPARNFFRGIYETELNDLEILVAARLPVRAPGERFAFDELSRRHGDFAIAGLCCRGRLVDKAIASLDLTFFGVGPLPQLATRAAARLVGTHVRPEDLTAAIGELGTELELMSDRTADEPMRLHLAGVLLKRLVPCLLKDDGAASHE